MTQRDRILKALREAGKLGVSAHRMNYEMGITRGAAIIFDLRQEGFDIETIDEGTHPDGTRKMARYVLQSDPERPKPPVPPPPEPAGVPREAKPLVMGCGCVRSADGREWESRCIKHDPANYLPPEKPRETVAW